VVSMGSYKGLKSVRKIVEDCMNNIHPIYNIKTLMIKRELAKDPALSNENWDRFLPKFKKKSAPKKKKADRKEKRDYTPFPPAPTPSKVDIQLESGEYFLSENQQKAKKAEQKERLQQEAVEKKWNERQKAFQPPKEKKNAVVGQPEPSIDISSTVEGIKKNVQNLKKRKSHSSGSSSAVNSSDFILSEPTTKKNKNK